MNITSLDLNLLLVLDALMVERSVTRAGVRLHMSQPTVSNALTRLRSIIGDPLFVRTRAGMEPTSRALELHLHIGQGLRLIERGLEQGSVFDPLASRNEFRIVLSDIGEVIYLPKLMRELKTVAPNVTVAASQLPRDRYGAALESGEVDLAIGTVIDESFYQQRLFDDVHICLVREGHPRVGRKLTMARFSEESHVTVAAIWNQANPFEVALRTRGIERRSALRVGHYLALPTIIRETDLLACLPSRAATAMLPMKGIRIMPLPFELPLLTVKLFWHRRNHHDRAARWFRSVVAKVLSEPSAPAPGN
ncbi:MAG: LysR family transcriptional regulator [Herminiimonas sp.]|nr:LysR family transcriptional regulator [Herminiimonas sp.]